MPIIFEDLSRVISRARPKSNKAGLEKERKNSRANSGENSVQGTKKKEESPWQRQKIPSFSRENQNCQLCFSAPKIGNLVFNFSGSKIGEGIFPVSPFSSEKSPENIAKTGSKFIPQFELCEIASLPPQSWWQRDAAHAGRLHFFAVFGNTNWLKMTSSFRPFRPLNGVLKRSTCRPLFELQETALKNGLNFPNDGFEFVSVSVNVDESRRSLSFFSRKKGILKTIFFLPPFPLALRAL